MISLLIYIMVKKWILRKFFEPNVFFLYLKSPDFKNLSAKPEKQGFSYKLQLLYPFKVFPVQGVECFVFCDADACNAFVVRSD